MSRERIPAVRPIWHELALQLNFGDGLDPYFAAHSVVRTSGGSRTVEFSRDGERWIAKLYYQDSGIVAPPSGSTLPGGSTWEFDSVREFRVSVRRHPDEDPVGEQSMNAHLRPRWDGMETENSDGVRRELEMPPGVKPEGMNVRLSGSNIDAQRYRALLADAARALDLNPDHFADPLPSSTVQDGERYVRVDVDASGPVHAREGPIARMAHLLENDRSGYRKLVQNDTDENGENVPGFYHTVTLGPARVSEAFPDHRSPVEIKHYRSRHAESMDRDDPLHHPKVGVSYQVSRWDGTVGVSADELDQLRTELDETLHAVLADAGLPLAPDGGAGGPPFVEDAYFPAEVAEVPKPPSLDLTQLKSEQRNVVVRELAKTGGVSPVEDEVYRSLLSDGGRVSPADIAEEHGRHVGSVRRALRRIDDMVDREYGEVSLRSPYVAELISDAVDEVERASSRLADATGEALLAAERGLSETASALRSWLAARDVEVDSRRDAVEKIRLGEVAGEMPASDPYAPAKVELRRALSWWTDTGRDPAAFRNATVTFSFGDRRGVRSQLVGDLI